MSKKKNAENQTDTSQSPNEATPAASFDGKINKYGFLRFGKEIYEVLGLPKGEDTPVTIAINPDRSVTVRRTG